VAIRVEFFLVGSNGAGEASQVRKHTAKK